MLNSVDMWTTIDSNAFGAEMSQAVEQLPDTGLRDGLIATPSTELYPAERWWRDGCPACEILLFCSSLFSQSASNFYGVSPSPIPGFSSYIYLKDVELSISHQDRVQQ